MRLAAQTDLATCGAGMMSAKSISEMVAETPRPEIHDNGRVVIETAGPGDFVGKAAVAGRSQQAPLSYRHPRNDVRVGCRALVPCANRS